MHNKILKKSNLKRRRSPMPVTKIDPACAVCGRADASICGCEAHALEVAIQQAEEHMMAQAYKDIRAWVRAKSREYILQHFQTISEPRKSSHSHHLDQITAMHAYHYDGPPAAAMLARATDEYRRGVSADWCDSVQRYPEVLQYYFSLVRINLPEDDADCVKSPPLGALNERRTSYGREEAAARAAATAAAAAAPAPGAVPHHHSHHHHRGHVPPAGGGRFPGHAAPFPFFRPPGF